MKKQLKFVTKATKTTIANGEHYVEACIKYPIYTAFTADDEEEGKPTTFDESDDEIPNDRDPQW